MCLRGYLFIDLYRQVHSSDLMPGHPLPITPSAPLRGEVISWLSRKSPGCSLGCVLLEEGLTVWQWLSSALPPLSLHEAGQGPDLMPV